MNEAIFRDISWINSTRNDTEYIQHCKVCPREATCSGKNDLKPLSGFWVPIDNSSTVTTKRRQQELNGTAGARGLNVYRCSPPTACLPANETYPNGLCMLGAYGPVCAFCDEKAGYFKSMQGCRKCHRQGTIIITIATGLVGFPLFLLLWYFWGWRPLVIETGENFHSKKGLRDIAKTDRGLAPKIKAIFMSCFSRDYIKIVIMFYQVTTSYLRNFDVPWPSPVVMIWKATSFFTLEIFKLPGYDCLFGGVNYFHRLIFVTCAPAVIILFFFCPVIVTFFHKSHLRKPVLDQFSSTSLWVLYVFYPLLCFWSLQGFHCSSVEGRKLLSVDMTEGCPYDSPSPAIFIWSVIAAVVYVLGIPLLLLLLLLQMDVPRLVRHGHGEAIFKEMLALYLSHRTNTVSYKIAMYVGGQGKSKAIVSQRVSEIFQEVSNLGELDVTGTRLLEWLETIGISGDNQEEVHQLFVHFDEGIIFWLQQNVFYCALGCY